MTIWKTTHKAVCVPLTEDREVAEQWRANGYEVIEFSALESRVLAERKPSPKDQARRFVSDFTREMGFAMSDHAQEVMLNLFLKHAASAQSIADTAGAKQDDVRDALDIAEQLDEMSDRITRFSNYEGDAVCARAAQLLRTFANHQAARRKVMSDGDLQDIVMGLFGRYTIPADYKLANSVAEFVMSKLPRSAPYGAPFTTDVAHCCGDPETCNDPCEPAIDTAGAKAVNAAAVTGDGRRAAAIAKESGK